jgi:hypothetical protein
MIKKFKKWIYKKAFAFIMKEHSKYLDSCGSVGTQLSFQGRLIERADFSDTAFHQCSFFKSIFNRTPFEKAQFNNCALTGASLFSCDLTIAKINHSLVGGIDWTGTFKGVMKTQMERLCSGSTTEEDLDNMSVHADGPNSVRLVVDEDGHKNRIRPKGKKHVPDPEYTSPPPRAS